MSLWAKYLVPINAAILLVWLVHTWWEVRAVEREHMESEANAILHLAKGLAAVQKERKGTGYRAFERAAIQFPDLDVMLVDQNSQVVASNVAGRLGRTWEDDGITAVLSGEQTTHTHVDDHHRHDGARVLDASVLIGDRSDQVLVVHVAKSLRSLETSLRAQRQRHYAFAGVLLVAVSIVVNVLTFWVVIHPLRRTHERLRQNNWMRDHPWPSREDEVQRLDRVVREMLHEIHGQHTSLRRALEDKDQLLGEVTELRDRLVEEVERVRRELSDAQQSLIRAERLNVLSSLSAGLAHELRNPLHIVRGTAETVARRHPETKSLVCDIVEEVDRIEKIVQELLDYTRPVTPHQELIDTKSLLERVRSRGCRRRDQKRCAGTCTISLASNCETLKGDPLLLEQALLNLLTNACEADGSPIEMRAERDESGGVRFTVSDRGSGIERSDLGHVFEPFYTKKTSGTGLGLPVVQRVAELHSGTVSLDSRPKGGTVATLQLPPEAEVP